MTPATCSPAFRRSVAAVVCGAIALTALAGDGTPPAPPSDTDARIAYYRARISGRGTYPAYARLGLAYLQKARETGRAKYYDEALLHLRQSLACQRNFEALGGMAVGLSEQHRFEEALPYAEEAIGAMPSNMDAQGVLFDIRLARGETHEAETVLGLMLEATPGFQSFVRQAALRECQGDDAGAMASMIKAREDATTRNTTATTRAWIEVRIGSLHVAQCDAARAREAYERALALMPGYFFANEHLAELHAAEGHWGEAERLYRRLLRVRPEPEYRTALAEIYREQEKPKSARREQDKVLAEVRQAIREGRRDPFRLLALALLDRENDVAEGLLWAERDWEIRKDALAADTLAWALFRNGRCDEALELSERALRTGNRTPAVMLHGALIRLSVGRAAEGRALAEQVLACPLALGPGERELAKMVRERDRIHPHSANSSPRPRSRTFRCPVSA